MNYLFGKNYSDDDESYEKSYGAYSGSYSGDEDSNNERYYKSSKKNLSKRSKNLDFHHGGHHHHERCAYQHFDSTSDGTSSTSSSSMEMMETKCGYSSHSGSFSSSGSSHEHHHHKKSMTTSSSKSKKLDKKLNKNNDLDEHVVHYSFHYVANSKDKKDVVIKSENLYCPKSSNPEDIERFPYKKSNLTKRASKNSDIITNMKISLTTNYSGILKLEFPTCKAYKSSGYEGEDFISHLIIPESNINNNNNMNNNEKTVLIDRKLDDGQKEFLLKYPGHTEENFREFNKESPGKKMVNVGLKPQESCIMHFFNKLPENQLSKSKKISILNENISKRGDYIAFPTQLYKKLETTAELTLRNNFSFSDVTSNEFNIRIKPIMNLQKKNAIQKKIEKFEITNQNEKAKHLKELLNAPGFSNFYASSQYFNEDNNSFTQFKKGISYSITGNIEITYLQIKSKIENVDEDFNLNNNNKKMNNKSSSSYYKKNYYSKKRY